MSETTEKPAAPTPKEVDAIVREYAAAQAAVKAFDPTDEVAAKRKIASEAAAEVKCRVIAMVQQFGAQHAKKSLRLTGLQTIATVTVAGTTVVQPEAVGDCIAYMGKQGIEDLEGRFFRRHVSYSLVEGPAEVLAGITLGARIRTKLDSLLRLCTKYVTNAPSLKVEDAAKLVGDAS